MRCPRDGSDLRPFTLDGITTDSCSQCHGVWLDASELSRVTSDKELEALAHAGAAPGGSALTCPRCAATLHAAHVERVEVDPCPKCKGVWLDAGELREAERQVMARRWNERRGNPGLAAFAARAGKSS